MCQQIGPGDDTGSGDDTDPNGQDSDPGGYLEDKDGRDPGTCGCAAGGARGGAWAGAGLIGLALLARRRNRHQVSSYPT